MSFIVTTSSNVNTTTAVARVNGKRRQRTVKNDSMDRLDRRHGLALGEFLSEILTPREKAMLRHPTGRQRVTQDASDPVRMVWEVNV